MAGVAAAVIWAVVVPASGWMAGVVGVVGTGLLVAVGVDDAATAHVDAGVMAALIGLGLVWRAALTVGGGEGDGVAVGDVGLAVGSGLFRAALLAVAVWAVAVGRRLVSGVAELGAGDVFLAAMVGAWSGGAAWAFGVLAGALAGAVVAQVGLLFAERWRPAILERLPEGFRIVRVEGSSRGMPAVAYGPFFAAGVMVGMVLGLGR
jgi:prepilin signal peptidase PulO-like enzyme (type II secretory pathway)